MKLYFSGYLLGNDFEMLETQQQYDFYNNSVKEIKPLLGQDIAKKNDITHKYLLHLTRDGLILNDNENIKNKDIIYAFMEIQQKI